MSFALDYTDDSGAMSSKLRRWQLTVAMVAWADRSAAPALLSALRSETPVRSGAMRGAWRYTRTTSVGSVTLTMANKQPYAAFVMGGTQPHTIRAVNAQALHWTDAGGGDHFAQSVQHPGTKANLIRERAWARSRAVLDATFKTAITEATI